MERGAGDSSWSRTASSYKRGHGIEKSLSQQIAYSQDTGACVRAELGQTSHYRQFEHEIEAEFPAQSETGPSTQSRGQPWQYWWSTGQQQPWGTEDCTFLKCLPSTLTPNSTVSWKYLCSGNLSVLTSLVTFLLLTKASEMFGCTSGHTLSS